MGFSNDLPSPSLGDLSSPDPARKRAQAFIFCMSSLTSSTLHRHWALHPSGPLHPLVFKRSVRLQYPDICLPLPVPLPCNIRMHPFHHCSRSTLRLTCPELQPFGLAQLHQFRVIDWLCWPIKTWQATLREQRPTRKTRVAWKTPPSGLTPHDRSVKLPIPDEPIEKADDPRL